MNDDTLSDTSAGVDFGRKPSVVLPFKLKAVTSEVSASEPNTEMVRVFEEYLKAAKAGKIKFVALALVDCNGIAFSTWEPAESNPQLITQALGAVGYLNFRFNEAAADGAGDDDPFQD